MFSFEKESRLAEAVIHELESSAPPRKVSERAGISARKVSRAVEKSIAVAVEEQKHQVIGYFGRVMLASKLRIKLKERGYDDDFSSVVIEGLLVELARARRVKRVG